MPIDYELLIVIAWIPVAIYLIKTLKEIEKGFWMLLKLREKEAFAAIKEAEG
ncbi:unnamed protein product [marine sediment metagenome]|uniref:Uncharacterized protein n=1 Tax=marine sediment metagenome TaxID=412755 RepID=X1IQE8_9ZZZZ